MSAPIPTYRDWSMIVSSPRPNSDDGGDADSMSDPPAARLQADWYTSSPASVVKKDDATPPSAAEAAPRYVKKKSKYEPLPGDSFQM